MLSLFDSNSSAFATSLRIICRTLRRFRECDCNKFYLKGCSTDVHYFLTTINFLPRGVGVAKYVMKISRFSRSGDTKFKIVLPARIRSYSMLIHVPARNQLRTEEVVTRHSRPRSSRRAAASKASCLR